MCVSKQNVKSKLFTVTVGLGSFATPFHCLYALDQEVVFSIMVSR